MESIRLALLRLLTAGIGPVLPISAVLQVGSYRGYSGPSANVVAKPACADMDQPSLMDPDFNNSFGGVPLTVAANEKYGLSPFFDAPIGRRKAIMNHADGTKPLTKEGLVRIYSGMSVAPTDVRSPHGNVPPRPRDGAALRALRFTFASFTSRRPPRS